MLFDLENVMVNMYVHLATQFKASGYDVFWHASGETEAQTAGLPQELGTITLIQDFPANPTFVVGGVSADYSDQDKVVVPAFALRVYPPRKIRRYGLGDPRFEREMDVRIGGVAADSRQQAALASIIYDWLQIGDIMFDFLDYDADEVSPPTINQKVEVWFADVATPEVATEVEQIRYQINTDLVLRYVE